MSYSAPVAQWPEPPSSTAAIVRLYWHFDSGTGAWDLTSVPTLESGKLADVGGGLYDFVTPASAVAPGTATINAAQRGTDLLVY